jgi:hypothetical protein
MMRKDRDIEHRTTLFKSLNVLNFVLLAKSVHAKAHTRRKASSIAAAQMVRVMQTAQGQVDQCIVAKSSQCSPPLHALLECSPPSKKYKHRNK